MKKREEYVKEFVKRPELLLKKKPFTRGIDNESSDNGDTVGVNGKVEAILPKFKRRIVSQEQFMRELDPNCHDCLFDENIPSICVKVSDNDFREIKYKRTAMPFQRIIRNKQVLHLTGYPMQFTLIEQDPTEKQMSDFMLFKDMWEERNQDGMKKLFAEKQLSLGDAGLLYYFDQDGQIKSRVLAYDDGYVLLPHNDENGDRVVEAVYYISGDDEYIDMYDKENHYRFKNSINENVPITESTIVEGQSTWRLVEGFPVAHGFNEIPLITKRGDVAWNDVQTLIDNYEVLYNVFNAIQKRFGWGLLYIKGKFNENAKKIAGSVVLNDTSLEGKGDAKFLTPPSPENTIMTLEKIEDNIKIGSSTTFILPKDVKTSGDISGIAIQLTQSLDIEKAEQNAKSYQNVANKMVRLFKHGLAVELVAKKEVGYEHAITEFDSLRISAKYKVWRPFSATEYNNMLVQLHGAGLLSTKTGIEKNTESTPDEVARVNKEVEEKKKEGIIEESTNTPSNPYANEIKD